MGALTPRYRWAEYHHQWSSPPPLFCLSLCLSVSLAFSLTLTLTHYQHSAKAVPETASIASGCFS